MFPQKLIFMILYRMLQRLSKSKNPHYLFLYQLFLIIKRHYFHFCAVLKKIDDKHSYCLILKRYLKI